MEKILKRITPFFFLILICGLVASTIFPQELANKFFYRTIWFKIAGIIFSAGIFVKAVNLLRSKKIAPFIAYLGFFLILLGGFWTSFLEVEGFIEIKEGQSVARFWLEDDLSNPLDFSILLKDFSVEFYPEERKEMHFIKSFKTSVVISKEGNVLKQGIIEVNKPLRWEGFWFYQYGYDPQFPNQTLLQVVKDPGLPIVYTGFLFLLGGMLLTFKKIFCYKWKTLL
ncbi:MAG: cytochrome c biogenesis protein ResB [Omnitrophica bacterium]|nr:cytochrome c biogenesis protein ResB [Candidatus Omnitrophota bacterium]